MNLLINGLITGAVFAIAASGLVVTYSTSGVFNFAHGALGMLCAYVYWDLRVNNSHTWPLLPKGAVAGARWRWASCCWCSRRCSARCCTSS